VFISLRIGQPDLKKYKFVKGHKNVKPSCPWNYYFRLYVTQVTYRPTVLLRFKVRSRHSNPEQIAFVFRDLLLWDVLTGSSYQHSLMLPQNIPYVYVLETDISVFSQKVPIWLWIYFPFIQLLVQQHKYIFYIIKCNKATTHTNV